MTRITPFPAVDGAFERTLEVTGPVDLMIQSGAGRIHVSPAAGDTVRVSAHLRGDAYSFSDDVSERIRQIEQNPPIEQNGDAISVGRFADKDLPRHITINYDVTVPAQSTVTASTGSGGIEVAAAASLKASSGSGPITATAIGGATTVKSGSGVVRIAQAGKGDLDVSSSSGEVVVTGVEGTARISASSGGIVVEGRPVGPWTVHTSSGDVTLRIPPDAAFDLDARVSSGRIDSAHPVTETVPSDKHRLQGKVGGGGALVDVKSSSGRIRIQ